MAYRMVYLRIRSSGYNFGWASDTEQAAFKEESRHIFQELGWALKPGSNGVCDTVTNGHQDLYLHPLSFSGVMDETNIQPLQEQLSKAQTFRCYHLDCYVSMKVRYKKHGILQFYESECLFTVSCEPPPVLTGPFERCEGCPYPGHGFVCWDRSGEQCLRTEMARIMERDRLVGFTG